MFAAVFVLLYVAHQAADYPGQWDKLATRKAGWTDKAGQHHHGWGENLLHAATHAVLCLVLLYGAGAVIGLHLATGAVAAGVAWVTVTHAVIDRRWIVRWWMEHTGQAQYIEHGGMLTVDQAAHVVVGLLPAALLIAALTS